MFAVLGDTYSNDHKYKEFIKAFSDLHLQEVRDLVKDADFFSLLCDGSTDSGVYFSKFYFYQGFFQNHFFKEHFDNSVYYLTAVYLDQLMRI